MDDFQKEMLDVFVFETNSFLEQLETILMQAETSEGDIMDAVPEIFRIMHTLKSSSAMMGFENISKLSHSMEDLFFFIREKKPTHVDKKKLTDIVLLGLDYIKRNMVPDANEDPADAMAQIKKYLEQLEKGGDAPTTEETAPCSLRVQFKPNCAMIGLRAFEIITKAERIQSDVLAIPADDDPQAEAMLSAEGLLLMLPTEEHLDEITAAIAASPFVDTVAQLKDAPQPSPKANAEPAAEAASSTEADAPPVPTRAASPVRPSRPTRDSSTAQSSGGYMGIEVKKLDSLINLSGEMIISSMGAAHAFESGDPEKTRAALDSLHRLILEIQDKTLALRMISLRDTFHKLNRAVRDATGKLEKQVLFHMSGEDTAVDRNVIDHVFSPLMHILRNSIDHGIENPEERIAAGKPPEGNVSLSAAIESDQVVLCVSDDGKGLDRESILMKAFTSGIITEQQAQSMTNEEVNALIFLPGFSTKQQVSELSGRGVGMDVVNDSVRKLSGKIIVTSTPGQGTRTEIRLPLSMAILDALLVRVSDEVCAIPITVVKEAFMPTQESIRHANGHDVVLHRDICFPIVRLADLLDLSPTPYDQGIMLLVDAEKEPYVLFISEALQQQSVVVKPIPALLRGIHGVYGCTILGDGQVCLILDASQLSPTNAKR